MFFNKDFSEMTKGQKVWSVIGTIALAPVAVPAMVGVATAAATTGAAIVTGAAAADPIGSGLSIASAINENF